MTCVDFVLEMMKSLGKILSKNLMASGKMIVVAGWRKIGTGGPYDLRRTSSLQNSGWQRLKETDTVRGETEGKVRI